MIRIFTSILFLLLIASKGNAQQISLNHTDSSRYIKEAILFLTSVKKNELSDSALALANTPKFSCFEYVIQDSVTFNDEEIAQIKAQITSPRINSWNAILPATIRFLDEKYVNRHSKLIKNPKREEKVFRKYFGEGYHNFSAPIFLKEYTYCLFYIDNIRAGGKSSGELQVFEKRDGIWRQLISRCEWTE